MGYMLGWCMCVCHIINMQSNCRNEIYAIPHHTVDRWAQADQKSCPSIYVKNQNPSPQETESRKVKKTKAKKNEAKVLKGITNALRHMSMMK